MNTPEPSAKPKWYRSTPVVILLLIFFPLAGIPLAWFTRWPRSMKITASVLSGFMLLGALGSNSKTETEAVQAPQPAPVQVKSSPVAKVQSAGIGVSRGAVQTSFEEYGFVFSEGVPANGQSNFVGKKIDAGAVIQLVGPANNLVRASFLVAPSAEDREHNAQATLLVAAFLAKVTPGWGQDGLTWFGNSLTQILDGDAEQVSTVYGTKKIKLMLGEGLGMIVLTVDPTQGQSTPDTESIEVQRPDIPYPMKTAASFKFPLATCGDGVDSPDSTWYPVFIDGADLDEVRSKYCADAVAATREGTGAATVQLASFSSSIHAQALADAVGGEVGKPDTALPDTTSEQSSSEAAASPEVALEAEDRCDRSYPEICIDPADSDVNCTDIPQKNFQVLQPDPHRLDRDADGIGCEST